MNLLAFALVVSLQGTVIKAGSNEPVAKAAVELKRVEGNDPKSFTATTSIEGVFTFNDVPPGEYNITVARAGFVKSNYGERRPGGPGTPVKIGDAPVTIRMTLTPTVVISGRILDRNGQPLGNATVQAMKMSFAQGRQQLRDVQSTITNDLGEYRLFYLPPAKYYVAAIPTVVARSMSLGGDTVNQFRMTREQATAEVPQSDEIGAPIYFPGTPDMLAAAALDLKPGSEARGIDIIAAPTKSRHVRGVVVSEETGQLVPGGPISIRMARGSSTSYRSVPSSTFDIPNVIPGSYIIGATVGSMSGKVPIEVFDRDLENVTIAISNAYTISGRITIEGATPQNPAPDVKTMRVLTRSEPNDGAQINTPTADAEGAFKLENVPQGTYRISLFPALQNAYLKSVRLGNSEGVQTGITIQGPPQGTLQIVVSMRAGSIEGKVLNERQQPLPNAVIVLVPETELRSRADLFKNVTSNAAGEYKMTGLVPGNYRLFAWEEVENGAWLNTDFLRDFEEHGVAVQVAESSAQKLELRALAP